MTAPLFPGLDHEFLRFIGVEPANQRRIQSFYLPYFADCTKVVDLGAGTGEFVELMQERGIDVTGVDADEKAVAEGLARGLPLVLQDVFDYLRDQPEASVDGVFAAHLVEHLPYAQVLELVQESYRILRPGGRLVLATPDVRSLFSHLEMFYLHFGHVTFYHPRLLVFFLKYAGFQRTELGVNPETASPLLPGVRAVLDGAAQRPTPVVTFRRQVPPQGSSLLAQVSFHVKRSLADWLVLPFADDLARSAQQQMNQLQNELQGEINTLADALRSLNGAFETYVTGVKPAGAASPT